MGIALKGDFIGFWIDNIHSSELGIIRTSDGSRFNENLLPTIQDKTVQVPGGDGFYYFGSYYTQRQFNIPIAFDNLEEKDFRRLRQIIGSKKMVKLVFDEAPYKYYSVKSTGSPTLKYICFDVEVDSSSGGADDEETQSGDSTPTQASAAENQDITNGAVYYQSPSSVTTKRVYKGEGTLNFIAYDPFGYARALSLEELKLPNGESISNTNDWVFPITDGTGNYNYPLPELTQTGSWSNDNGAELGSFCNSGDQPCDYQIICIPSPETTEVSVVGYQYVDDVINPPENRINLLLKDYTLKAVHIGFCFDSKTNCVYGVKQDNEINEIDYDVVYNEYLITSNFAKMPVGNQTLVVQGVTDAPTVKIKFKYF